MKKAYVGELIIDRNVFGGIRIRGHFHGCNYPIMDCSGYTKKDAIRRYRMTYGGVGLHLDIIEKG